MGPYQAHIRFSHSLDSRFLRPWLVHFGGPKFQFSQAAGKENTARRNLCDPVPSMGRIGWPGRNCFHTDLPPNSVSLWPGSDVRIFPSFTRLDRTEDK